MPKYPHFDDVIPCILPERSGVDVLIGLDNSAIMRVLREQTSNEGEPHTIETPIGWITSGGKFQKGMNCQTHKISVSDNIRIKELEQLVREFTKEDEVIQPSVNDKKAQQLVEDNIKVIDSRYQIPIPLKENIHNLPSNYELARKRANGLRKHMLRRHDLQYNYLLLMPFKDSKRTNSLYQLKKTRISKQTISNTLLLIKQKPELSMMALLSGRDGLSMISFIPVLTCLTFWPMF